MYSHDSIRDKQRHNKRHSLSGDRTIGAKHGWKWSQTKAYSGTGNNRDKGNVDSIGRNRRRHTGNDKDGGQRHWQKQRPKQTRKHTGERSRTETQANAKILRYTKRTEERSRTEIVTRTNTRTQGQSPDDKRTSALSRMNSPLMDGWSNSDDRSRFEDDIRPKISLSERKLTRRGEARGKEQEKQRYRVATEDEARKR